MVTVENPTRRPFGLVVTGEAETWLPALERIVGPDWLNTRNVATGRELLETVETGAVDAAVLDEEADLGLDVLQVLRMVRRVNQRLPVVVVTARRDRRWLEDALRLTAFSVVVKPLELEVLLRQIQRMMQRLDAMLRRGPHAG